MAAAIEIEGLRKEYRSRSGPIVALADLDLAVPEGGVFGFLGANGAGKTTTIRALVGHLRASGGRMRVLGHDVPGRLPDVIDRIGALVEQPAFFPNFSGRRNLDLLARSRGLPRARVAEVLDTVGLSARADSRVGTYSLGMKQRLGVAAVLVKDPELLILDEPANGLDPTGIAEMRNLLRRLGGEGRTVFVSSHILSEVEQTCDGLGIIAHGRAVATGSVREILSGGPARVRVRVAGGLAELQRAQALLADDDLAATGVEDGSFVVEIAPDHADRVTRVLAGGDLWVRELVAVERSLEDAFLALTAEEPAP